MNNGLKRGHRCILVAAALILGTQAAHAQNAEARGIVVDSNGKIYQANYLCDVNPDCSQALVKLTDVTVKAGSAVAIGAITPAQPANYVFIANSGKKGKIQLLVEESVGTVPWSDYSFDGSDGATAMVITRNVGTLFVARDDGAVEAYRRDGMGVQGYNTTPAGANQGEDFSFSVPFGGGSCQDIVGLEEWPANSGDLLIVCNSPGGVIAVDMPDDGLSAPVPADFTNIAAPNSLGSSLKAGAVSTVPVDTGVKDYALIVAEPSEVLAIDLADFPNSAPVQRNVLIGGGRVRDLATGLCFRDPNNESDGDEDVDEVCFSIVQSGNAGKTAYVELSADASGVLTSNIVDTINGALKNTFGVDLINTGTVLRSECLSPDGCQIANHNVVDKLAGVVGEVIAFETQGSFTDLRYNPLTMICDRNADGSLIFPDGGRVELPLEFTGIPILKEASIGPEFCARNGTFFVDIISAPGITPTSGFTQYESPGQCWMPGDGANLMGPGTAVPLDVVEYGLLFGDQFDLLRIDGTDEPISGAESYDDPLVYVTNKFAQDTLIGCATRVRAGGRYTFIIEDFVGNQLGTDIGDIDMAIADNVLFQYGDREGNQRIEIPVLSPQSGCFEELDAPGYLIDACEDHVTALNGGLAGWGLQRLVGLTELVTSADLDGVISSGDTQASLALTGDLNGLTLNVLSDPNAFSFRRGRVIYDDDFDELTPTVGIDVLGVSGTTSGEIDIGQSVTFTVSTTPRPSDLVLNGGGGSALPVEVGVPFRADSLTLALLFDGPEFSDVQEAARITVTLSDGVQWTATLVNLAEPDGATDMFDWITSSNDAGRPAPSGPPEFQVLSGDDSSSDSAVVRVIDPFEGALIMSLEITAIAGDPSAGCPSCSNQSDMSFLDIELGAVDRVEALSFAYQNYLRALCSVSTRPDFSMGMPGTRPNICTNDVLDLVVSDPAAFNEIGMPASVERNIAGYQQADIEGVLRFISHNICELDFDTDIDPGEIGFGAGQFCQVPPEWAP